MSLRTHVSASATDAWLEVLAEVSQNGAVVSPRGKSTLELPHISVGFDLSMPLVEHSERKLSYKYMAAEVLWYLSGSNSVADIVPYNHNLLQYSDNGKVFNGAYGPPIADQLPYVVQELRRDPSSRRAVLTIWRPNPRDSKDIPCTVAMAFQIRDGKINAHVFMRSSDAFLGLPYDLFAFSMVAIRVACSFPEAGLLPGNLYWTAASSHIYEADLESVKTILTSSQGDARAEPIARYLTDWKYFEVPLVACRDGALKEVPMGYWGMRGKKELAYPGMSPALKELANLAYLEEIDAEQ